MIGVKRRVEYYLDLHFTTPSINWKQSMSIVIPQAAEHLFTILFGLLNTGMISSSGVTSLSAVSLVDTLNNFLFVFYTGIATGAGVVVANYRGRNDPEKLHLASVQAVTAVVLFTIFTSVFILLFHQPLLTLLFGAVEPEVMSKSRLYLLGGSLTLPLLGIPRAICGVLRGIGEGKTSLVFTISSTIVYVVLNVLFLTVLDLGIPGLILSISLNRIIDIFVLLVLLRKTQSQFGFRIREFFHIDLSIFRSIIRVGFPCAAEQLFFTGGRLVTQTIIVPMGTNAIVTYNVAYSIMLLNQAFASPLNSSMFTITGICMGNERPQDARKLAKSYICLNALLFVIAFGLVLLSFKGLTAFYNAPIEVVPMIYSCIIITGIAHPLLHAVGFTLPSVFRAAGDGVYCTISILIIMWIVRVFGGYVLGSMLGMGVLGVWIAMVLDWVVRCVLFPLRFKGDKWLSHKVI